MPARQMHLLEGDELKHVFESSPTLCVVVDANLKIVAATDAYLRATKKVRAEILGRGIFEVFPDNPNDPHATGVRNLAASFNRVFRNRQPDTMSVQKYDIRRPWDEGGEWEERYWSPVNAPVFSRDEPRVLYIVHRVEDVTPLVRLSRSGEAQAQTIIELRERSERMQIDVALRGKELKEANQKLDAMHSELDKAGVQFVEARRTIDRQQAMLRRLSVPILPLAKRLLVAPLMGDIDAEEMRDFTTRLLAQVDAHRSRAVVIDFTGVSDVAADVAAQLEHTIKAARLLGAEVIITGVSTKTAAAILEHLSHFKDVRTAADLASGIEELRVLAA